MVIEKILHIDQPLEEAKARMECVYSYARQLDGVKRAVISPEGLAYFEFSLDFGIDLFFDLEISEGERDNEIYFRSNYGNVEILGMLEFVPINSHLTEIVLTFHYELKPLFYRVMDRCIGLIEQYIINQFARLEVYFQSIGSIGARATKEIRHESFYRTPVYQ